MSTWSCSVAITIFVRPHGALKFGREIRTPAMQAGLTIRRLTFRDIFLGDDDSFVVADRGFPAQLGAQPGLFRTCTTARSRVATYLDSSINTFLKKVFLRAARPNR